MEELYNNTRQQEIAEKAARIYGVDPNEITGITTQYDIPTSFTYSNASGTNITRDVRSLYGQLLTNQELSQIKSLRALSQDMGNSLESLNGYNGLYQQQKNQEPVLFEPLFGPKDDSSFNTFDPSANRLGTSGLPSGAQFNSKTGTPIVKFKNSQGNDYRVRIIVPSALQQVLLKSSLSTSPLVPTNGVLFPYTPQITVNHAATYNAENLTHSNYAYQFYQSSTVEEISITGTFASKNAIDANYVVAAQHFFRTVTKMFYGQDEWAGVPPPVLRLDGHGDLQFSSVPIVITSFSVNYPDDVDYITTNNQRFETRVPVIQQFNINCRPIYSRKSISGEFSLTGFAAGQLLAVKNGRGGFI